MSHELGPSLASSKPITRLIFCVDGTYCNPDGTDGKGHGNVTNVFRIYASVKEGNCYDEITQKTVFQKKKYEPGISAEELNPFKKAKAGLYGTGCDELIRNLYRECCLLDKDDEVWLFGFSRGAYVVRAVAGLLHHITALNSTEVKEFKSDYDKALKFYDSKSRKASGPGQAYSFRSSKVKPAPQVRFVGVFDTVKALEDGNLHDLSFNNSTQHFRQALALNEDRRHMKPENESPNFDEAWTTLSQRSFLQAWFVGAHIDMGGSEKKDGLALYPLQWILGESQSKGLVLEFHPVPEAPIDNPLRVVLLQSESDGKDRNTWRCTTKNGVNITMQDLREVNKPEAYGSRYDIKINSRKGAFWPRKAREIFGVGGKLHGYCEWSAQGTIIHPSVYQFLDEVAIGAAVEKTFSDRDKIQNWRPKMLGEENSIVNRGFWGNKPTQEIDGLKSLRILVCGNTGVGKSTLINKVFGVSPSDEVTKSSDRKRGLHDVREEIVHKNRPDLIIHDSGGFEAGDESQMRAVGEFVTERSLQTKIEDRLHVIWFCVEMNSSRTQQRATETLFKAVSKHADEVPIIVVVTKRDQFRSMQYGQARETYELSIHNQDQLHKECKEHAAKEMQERMELIEKEMQEVDGGHFDACVDVEKNNLDTIRRLNAVTLQNVGNEALRLLYVATQVADINLKVTAAISQVMKVYKSVLATATTLSFIPTAPSTNRTASAISICKAVVQCFGIPTVNYHAIYRIVSYNVWDDLPHNISIALAEGVNALGVLASIAFGGVPFFLASAAVNFPMIVPATTRLMLMLASDLILIMVRAFSVATLKCLGQPQEKDVVDATLYYRSLSSRVHKEILKLVPKSNALKSFRYNEIQKGLEETVDLFKEEITENLRSNSVIRPNKNSFSSDHASIKAELDELRDITKDAKVQIEEVTDETPVEGQRVA